MHPTRPNNRPAGRLNPSGPLPSAHNSLTLYPTFYTLHHDGGNDDERYDEKDNDREDEAYILEDQYYEEFIETEASKVSP